MAPCPPPAIHERFIKAKGEIEFQTDGTCVNTTDGWKEVKPALGPVGSATVDHEHVERFGACRWCQVDMGRGGIGVRKT